MTHPHEPAFIQNGITKGLTKREYFAAMRKPVDTDSGISLQWAKTIMGGDPPSYTGGIEWIQWWLEAEEKLSVMRADALIKALNND